MSEGKMSFVRLENMWCNPKKIEKPANVSTLDFLQENVKGLIDHVSPEAWGCKELEGFDVWVNDEGLINNIDLSVILRPDLFKTDIDNSGVLLGPIVITKTDKEGNTIGLNPLEVKLVKKQLKNLIVRSMAATMKIKDMPKMEL